MGVTAVVGANWGDEGKGKMVDYFAGESDFVIRYQGGANAGHTIINEFGKFALHLIPSGIFHSEVKNILGPGVAVDILKLREELRSIEDRKISSPNLYVSERAQVLMPYHILFDQLEEERLGDQKFGSTKSGIAPFYSDKYMKVGIQVADLYEPERLIKRINSAIAKKNIILRSLYNYKELSSDQLFSDLLEQAKFLKPFVTDTTSMLFDAVKNGKRILLEGQLGALRDPDHGIYPFPTSSSTLAGFASVGAGIPAHSIDRVVAVTKAYSTCVGAGPFITELEGSVAEELRKRGGDSGEYGATTGRPRRVGWFDVPATAYGCRVQGATELALTNLDVLEYLDEIPVCTKYSVDGEDTKVFPVPARLDRAKPVYTTLPGWRTDISGIRNFDDLPENAQKYVKTIETLCDTQIKYISIGPHRDQIIIR